MARRRKSEKRNPGVDPRYESPVVAELINTVLKRGKKSLAQRLVYAAIDDVNEGNNTGDPLEVLTKAIDNVKPRLEVKARRVGGSTYQVPLEVPPARQLSLAIRWLVSFADGRKGVPMSRALANEIRDAAAGQGNAIKKRDDVHRMAQANRAFAHLRW